MHSLLRFYARLIITGQAVESIGIRAGLAGAGDRRETTRSAGVVSKVRQARMLRDVASRGQAGLGSRASACPGRVGGVTPPVIGEANQRGAARPGVWSRYIKEVRTRFPTEGDVGRQGRT